MQRRGEEMSRFAGRWRVLGALVGVLALSVTAGCGGTQAQWQSNGAGVNANEPAKLPAKLTFAQDNNAVVSPAALISVQVANGVLDTVSMTNAEGTQVQGTLDTDRKLWKNAEPLGYDKAYTITATSTGDDGKQVTDSRTFSTLKPGNFTLPYIRAFRNGGPLLDGGTFGVGQPIVIQFDEEIADRAAAVRSLTVTTDPPTEGAWRWVQDDEVHWRPKAYWAPGTKVTVVAKVYGIDLGNGMYGQEDRTASFTIGPSKIAIADHDTHLMQIFINGVDITATLGDSWNGGLPGFNYDHSGGARISMGAQGARTATGAWFDMRTSSGPHVVMEKAQVVKMRPALPKTDPLYYEEDVPYAVRITASGEYVHWADWSVYDQGVRNVSHGCINMSPNDAVWFFNNFSYGDIVDVRNTGKQQDLTDGLGDWNMSWEEWSAAA
jgi:lipoprotein-anchoring transpeptidase ErfK/SrfK